MRLLSLVPPLVFTASVWGLDKLLRSFLSWAWVWVCTRVKTAGKIFGTTAVVAVCVKDSRPLSRQTDVQIPGIPSSVSLLVSCSFEGKDGRICFTSGYNSLKSAVCICFHTGWLSWNSAVTFCCERRMKMAPCFRVCLVSMHSSMTEGPYTPFGEELFLDILS